MHAGNDRDNPQRAYLSMHAAKNSKAGRMYLQCNSESSGSSNNVMMAIPTSPDTTASPAILQGATPRSNTEAAAGAFEGHNPLGLSSRALSSSSRMTEGVNPKLPCIATAPPSLPEQKQEVSPAVRELNGKELVASDGSMEASSSVLLACNGSMEASSSVGAEGKRRQSTASRSEQKHCACNAAEDNPFQMDDNEM
eukprot:CAMPEP_0185254852 /NCGR_PEP_ID=MMETSP1359-20130426/3807_1 /TAXON_ID=552665 /ORGANISM="Bigelowiella longifila, Strain CCMP242" /LENGTH=195 /DNA_ID=CAMNT_0027838293 /DNA_START=234 /DNA_END=818 /DNA_ORIENTATION=-